MLRKSPYLINNYLNYHASMPKAQGIERIRVMETLQGQRSFESIFTI